jgi:hypothetical protein
MKNDELPNNSINGNTTRVLISQTKTIPKNKGASSVLRPRKRGFGKHKKIPKTIIFLGNLLGFVRCSVMTRYVVLMLLGIH